MVDWATLRTMAITPSSTRLAKDLKRRGFRFVGPTTVYAFMQSTGMVNDHIIGCHRHAPCAALQRAFRLPRRREQRGGR